MSEFDDFDSQLEDDADSVWLGELFERTRLPGTAEELSSEAEVIGAMVRTITHPPLVSDINARRRLHISKTATRTAIVVAALLVGTSTAAASGNLPDAAQSAVSRASSHLGVDIPDPYEERDAGEYDGSPSTSVPATTEPVTTEPVTTEPENTSIDRDGRSAVTVPVSAVASTNGVSASTNPGVDPTASQAGPGPDATGPAKQGLCRAWTTHESDSPANEHSTAMNNLQAAAVAAGQTVAAFCAEVLGALPSEVTTTTYATPPGTVVEGDGNEVKTTAPGSGDNSPPNTDDKDKKPKGGS